MRTKNAFPGINLMSLSTHRQAQATQLEQLPFF